MKNKYFGRLKNVKPRGIQSTIMFAISVISISIMLILGIVMYIRFSFLSRQEITQSTQKLMEQAGENLEDYLGSMRQISDAIYYNVIKENDLSNQDMDIQDESCYEANRDNLRSIAIYNNYGESDGSGTPCIPERGPGCDQTGLVQKGYGENGEYAFFHAPHSESL